MVSIALPEQTRSPRREGEGGSRTDNIQNLRYGVRVRQKGDADEHGGDTRESDETTLNRIPRFGQRLVSGEDPFEGIQNHQGQPDEGTQRKQYFADHGGEVPHLGGDAPAVTEADDPEHDAKESGRHSRQPRAVCGVHRETPPQKATIGRARPVFLRGPTMQRKPNNPSAFCTVIKESPGEYSACVRRANGEKSWLIRKSGSLLVYRAVSARY